MPPTCSVAVNPDAVSVKQNFGSIATVVVSVPGAATSKTVTAVPANANEVAAATYVNGGYSTSGTVPANGSLSFQVASLRNNSGFTYQIAFRVSGCTEANLAVTVTK